MMKKMMLGIFLMVSCWAGAQDKQADATLTVHVISSRYADGLNEILTVRIGKMMYEMDGATSNAKMYSGHGNGLLAPGDYPARLVTDQHKSSYESYLEYELQFPDGKTRKFTVIRQGELGSNF